MITHSHINTHQPVRPQTPGHGAGHLQSYTPLITFAHPRRIFHTYLLTPIPIFVWTPPTQKQQPLRPQAPRHGAGHLGRQRAHRHGLGRQDRQDLGARLRGLPPVGLGALGRDWSMERWRDMWRADSSLMRSRPNSPNHNKTTTTAPSSPTRTAA